MSRASKPSFSYAHGDRSCGKEGYYAVQQFHCREQYVSRNLLEFCESLYVQKTLDMNWQIVYVLVRFPDWLFFGIYWFKWRRMKLEISLLNFWNFVPAMVLERKMGPGYLKITFVSVLHLEIRSRIVYVSTSKYEQRCTFPYEFPSWQWNEGGVLMTYHRFRKLIQKHLLYPQRKNPLAVPIYRRRWRQLKTPLWHSSNMPNFFPLQVSYWEFFLFRWRHFPRSNVISGKSKNQ